MSTNFASRSAVFVEHLKRDGLFSLRPAQPPRAGRKRASSKGQPLTAQDAARWAMSTQDNPMVITAVLLLDATVERAALLELLEHELRHDMRWTSQVIIQGPLLHPHWRHVSRMVWGEHVEEHCLPEEVALTSLQVWLERVTRRPLPKQKPLWRLYLVTGPTGATAIVLRVHHCIADGGTLLQLLDALCEPISSDRPVSGGHTDERHRRAPGLREEEHGALESSRTSTSIGPRPTTAVSPLRSLLSPATELFAAHRKASGPSSRLSGEKRLRSTRPFSLEALRESARRHDTRLTPLLLSATVSGVSAGFALKRKPPPASLLALIPVDLRSPSSVSGGNQFASGLVRLSTHPANATEQLRVAHRALDRLKARPHANGWGRWIEAVGLLPRFVERFGVWWVTRQVDLSLSSIKGPAHTLSLLGARVRDLVVWSPAAGRIGLSVTLTSYAGSMRIGVLADDAIVSDPNKLISSIEEELAGCA